MSRNQSRDTFVETARSDWTYDKNVDSAFNRTGKSLEYNKIANEIPTHGNFFTDTINTLYGDGKYYHNSLYRCKEWNQFNNRWSK